MIKILISLILIVNTVACQAESSPVSATKQPQQTTESIVQEKVSHKEKSVCINVWDSSQKKEIKKCRILKIHEKKDGTKVPQK